MPTASGHCTFCDLIHGRRGSASICHEDSDAIAFMDIQPVNNGPCPGGARATTNRSLDVPQELGLHLFKVTMRIGERRPQGLRVRRHEHRREQRC